MLDWQLLLEIGLQNIRILPKGAVLGVWGSRPATFWAGVFGVSVTMLLYLTMCRNNHTMRTPIKWRPFINRMICVHLKKLHWWYTLNPVVYEPPSIELLGPIHVRPSAFKPGPTTSQFSNRIDASAKHSVIFGHLFSFLGQFRSSYIFAEKIRSFNWSYSIRSRKTSLDLQSLYGIIPFESSSQIPSIVSRSTMNISNSAHSSPKLHPP